MTVLIFLYLGPFCVSLLRYPFDLLLCLLSYTSVKINTLQEKQLFCRKCIDRKGTVDQGTLRQQKLGIQSVFQASHVPVKCFLRCCKKNTTSLELKEREVFGARKTIIDGLCTLVKAKNILCAVSNSFVSLFWCLTSNTDDSAYLYQWHVFVGKITKKHTANFFSFIFRPSEYSHRCIL